MFKVLGHKTLIKDIHRISANYFVIYSDDQFDLIYSGTNVYGNRLLGIIVFEDDENNFLRYFRVLITEEIYTDFLYRRITLINLLKLAENFFIVDVDYQGSEIDVNLVQFSEVPDSYIPKEDSYCPHFTFEPSLNYGVSLKGNMSDRHVTTPTDLTEVNTHFSDFLKNATDFLWAAEIKHKVLVEALKASSFQIHFRIEIEEAPNLALYNNPAQKINDYLNKYIQYILNELPYITVSIEENNEYKILRSQLRDILVDLAIESNDKINASIDEQFYKSIQNLTSIDYKSSFAKIEVFNYSNIGIEIPLGLINQEIADSVVKNSVKPSVALLSNKPQKEDKANMYQIRVYIFNTHSGKGSALIAYDDNRMDKITFSVSGRKNYENTIFTRSMDSGTVVEVEGIAERLGDKILKLFFTLD